MQKTRDGVYTEVNGSVLQEGLEVVTAIRTAVELRAPVTTSPLFGPQRRWGHFH